MDAVRAHWLTTLTLLGAVFLVVVGAGMIVSGGDDDSTGVRIYGAIGLLGGLALFGGLHLLRSGTGRDTPSTALIIVGMLILGLGFWWFIFIPAIIASVVLVFGVYRRGLHRELGAV